MHARDRGNNRKAQAIVVILAMLARSIDPVETVKEARKVLFGNLGARIGNGQHDFSG